MQSENLGNYGYIIDEIPKDIFNDLKSEVSSLEIQNEKMTSGLSGPGVPNHFFKNRNNLTYKRFEEYILSLKDVYLNTYKEYLHNYRILSDDLPFALGNPWFNVQKKHEYLPNHIHDGILSYSAWIKIPYDRNLEINSCDANKKSHNRKTVASFEFLYMSVLGNFSTKILPVDKSYEGKIMMFPSTLPHCVYPFYTSDDVRISLSGNIVFNSRNLNDK